MAMDPYEFVPKQSVGLFRLGSSRKENEGLSNIYGDITFENDVRTRIFIVEAVTCSKFFALAHYPDAKVNLTFAGNALVIM